MTPQTELRQRNPYWADAHTTIHCGDAREVLRQMLPQGVLL